MSTKPLWHSALDLPPVDCTVVGWWEDGTQLHCTLRRGDYASGWEFKRSYDFEGASSPKYWRYLSNAEKSRALALEYGPRLGGHGYSRALALVEENNDND